MPRSVSGNYTLPLPPVVPNTTIEAAWANTTDDDIAQALTDSLDRYGRGGMVAAFRLVDGSVGVPAWAFSAETGTGMYREAAGILSVSIQGAKVGQWAATGYTGAFSGTLTGDPTFDGTVTFSDEFPIVLSHPGGTILWNDGTIRGYLQHVAVGDFMQLTATGVGGIALSNASASMTFIAGVFSPGVSAGVDLGSTTKRWGSANFEDWIAIGSTDGDSTYRLSIDGPTSANRMRIKSTTALGVQLVFLADGATEATIGTIAAHPLSFMTNSAPRLIVAGDGRVYGTALHNSAGSVAGTTNQYLASGTYTPNIINVVNVASSISAVCQWMRVGNVVTVSGIAEVTATAAAATLTAFFVSLPIGTSGVIASTVGGVAASPGAGGTQTFCAIELGTANAAYFSYLSNTTSSRKFMFCFSYVL